MPLTDDEDSIISAIEYKDDVDLDDGAEDEDLKALKERKKD